MSNIAVLSHKVVSHQDILSSAQSCLIDRGAEDHKTSSVYTISIVKNSANTLGWETEITC